MNQQSARAAQNLCAIEHALSTLQRCVASLQRLKWLFLGRMIFSAHVFRIHWSAHRLGANSVNHWAQILIF
jgi:hypothetical protein